MTNTDPKENTSSLMEHLEELRDRLKKCAISVIVAFIIAYFFSEELFYILVKPLKILIPDRKLIFTGLLDMFFTYLKISLAAGLVGSSPYIFYQFWKFVAPGLYKHEQRLMLPFVFTSTLLFISGALFGYFIIFPFGFAFFIGFENEIVQALPSVKEYFSLSLLLLIVFGVVFELPVILFFLAKLGMITPQFLKKNRKYAILLAFIVAALLTPPDLFTQFAMAIPLIILYEISIFAIKFARPVKKDDENKEEENTETKDTEKKKDK